MLWTPVPQSQYVASFKSEERHADFRPSLLAGGQTFNKALGMVDGELQKGCEHSARVKVTEVPRNQMLGAEYARLK